MMEIALIGDKHTMYGFRLAGIRKTYCIEDSNQEDIRGILKGLFEGGTALILITESIASEMGDLLREADRWRKGIMPIILQIPESSGPLVAKVDPMRELIKRTVGFELA
jgi:V/A-type H+-transporting ATPase subunit F